MNRVSNSGSANTIITLISTLVGIVGIVVAVLKGPQIENWILVNISPQGGEVIRPTPAPAPAKSATHKSGKHTSGSAPPAREPNGGRPPITSSVQQDVSPQGSPSDTARSTDSPASVISPISAIEEDDLAFEIKACRRTGSSVSILGAVKNKGLRSRWVYFGSGVDVIDDEGNEYEFRPPSHVKAKIQYGADLAKELEPSLPINFSVAVSDVDPLSKALTLILTYGAPPPGQRPPVRIVWLGEKYPTKLVFKSMLIQP